MVALEGSPSRFTQLFGLDILFEAISDPKRAANIKLLHNFDYRKLIELTARHDVFSREDLANAWRTISERDGQVNDLIQTAAERGSQIDHLARQIQAQEHQFVELNQGLEERDDRIADLGRQLEARDGRITELNQGLEERDDRIADLGRQLEARNVRIAELDQGLAECEKRLAAMVNSLSWRLTHPIRLLKHYLTGNIR
jgi:chromosome segregation ATPase